MWPALARMILKQVLGGPEVKARVIAELRNAAKGTDNKIDDSLVDAVDVIWDVVCPIIVGKV